ncbi:MAG: PD40 domain-containing protein [Myxococcales bacterium]|nr:PD40 domain-containing protein [Myxococcales bacterium]
MLELYGTEGFDVCRDGRRVVFDRNERYRGAYSFGDLFLYDRQSDRTTRLTNGARVREPACSVDGRWVAAAQIHAGRARLITVDLADGAITVLHDPGGLDQMAFPVLTPDGRAVVALRVSQTHGRDLVRVDRATGAVTPLTDDGALELHPHFSLDGRWLLWASDRTGVYQIHGRPWPDGEARQLTRVVGGALDPALSPDNQRLVWSGIVPEGYDLFEAPFLPDGVGRPPPPPARAPAGGRHRRAPAQPPLRAARDAVAGGLVAQLRRVERRGDGQPARHRDRGRRRRGPPQHPRHLHHRAHRGRAERRGELRLSRHRAQPERLAEPRHRHAPGRRAVRRDAPPLPRAQHQRRDRAVAALRARRPRGSASIRYGLTQTQPAENPDPIHDPSTWRRACPRRSASARWPRASASATPTATPTPSAPSRGAGSASPCACGTPTWAATSRAPSCSGTTASTSRSGADTSWPCG